ncbi:MAG: hypothetical protein GY827_06715 [Cytophagales bacterium]|nr:hypothetical protein [Cytophagales bacterium]
MRRFFRLFVVAALSAGVFTAKAGEEGTTSTQRTTIVLNEKEGDQQPSSYEQQTAALAPKQKKTQLRFSGYTRIMALYRDMGDYYADNVNLSGRPLTLPVTVALDDGASQPLLMLRIEANPSANSSLQIESSLNNNLLNNGTGITNVDPDTDGKFANIFAGFHVKGSTITPVGKFTMTAGAGSIWAKMSPFTLWNFQYRDDMFERYPWDPAGSNWRRYESFYSTGDIPRDQRWGNRGMQGFMIEGEDMPFGLTTKIMYGKTRSAGGFENWSSGIPQNMFGARIGKRLGTVVVGANFYDQFGYDVPEVIKDSVFVDIYNPDNDNTYIVEESNKTSQMIVTADAAIKMNNLRLYTELGAGSYLTRTYYNQNTFDGLEDGATIKSLGRNWSPLVYVEADIRKGLIGWPFKAMLYHIGPHAVNNQSTFLNSSVEEATDGRNVGINSTESIWNVYFYDGMVTEIGQLTNNRQGIELTSNARWGKLVAELGLQFAQEVVNHGTTVDTSDFLNGVRGADATAFDDAQILEQGQGGVRNSITFAHLVNQYQRSRFHYNQRFQGPYRRLQSDFRRAWENVAITDTTVDYKKGFSVIDFSLKYKTKVFKRDLILTGFFRQNTVTDGAPLPYISAEGKDGAFFVQRYEELMFFYKLSQKVTLIGVAGWEQNKANKDRTELAYTSDSPTDATTPYSKGDAILENGRPVYNEDGAPIDQVGYGYGIGIDYDFTDRASLDARYKIYGHKDKNFTRDVFNGQEITLELKVFF